MFCDLDKYFIEAISIIFGIFSGFGIGCISSWEAKSMVSSHPNVLMGESLLIPNSGSSDSNVHRCEQCENERADEDGIFANLHSARVGSVASTAWPDLDTVVVNNDEGKFSDQFVTLVGMTENEETKIEKILVDCLAIVKEYQQANLVQMDDSSTMFKLEEFSIEGEQVKDEFISKIREILDESKYERFMIYGAKEIIADLGYFGKYASYFTFRDDGGELRLSVTPEFSVEGGPASQFFLSDELPAHYSHLFGELQR